MSHLELTRIEFGLWRAFQSEGSSSLPAHPVFDRWRRVQRLGVRPEGSPESQELLRGGDLRARQERSAALMGAASEVLPASESVFDDAHYSLLLTDEKGLILRSQAGGEFGGTARKLHLIEGGRWSEEVQGTNAIGTALVEERPVAVAGCAHFVRSNHALICYASPIRDPYGRIVGVLDATSHAEAAHPAIQLAVLHGARAIQEALRSRAWASAGERGVGSVLRQSDAPAFLVEWPGVIMASNATAERTLPVPLVGSSLEQVCGLGWEALVAQVGRGLDRLEVPRWGPGGRPRQVALHPVEGPPGMILGVVVVVEPATDRTLSVTARKPVPSVAAGATSPFASLLGSDPVMRRTKELAARIAPSNLPVLLLAETGTGKGLLARAIHNASGRGRGPLMDINCGALSPQLLESELFGYAPGAFTGAKRSGHEGKIHHAAGGTLFLDEVAEMSPSLQVMLLKVLEEGVYYRVGENQPRRSDFRLIAATCRDLDGLVADGTFRRDLYYRIRGATLTLPTLRERSDLIELSQGLLRRLASEGVGGGGVPELSAEAVAAIAAHDWPGNVRELRMALEFAMTVARSSRIEIEDLPPELIDGVSGPGPEERRARTAPTEGRIESSKREALLAALRATAGNLSATARRLGVARSTVYRMIERYDVRLQRMADPGE